MSQKRNTQWMTRWPAGATIDVTPGVTTGHGSLHRYSQGLPRAYGACLRRLSCGHVGMTAAGLWLFTVLFDLWRSGEQKITQARVISEAGLSRSTGKRAFGDLERGGFIIREARRVLLDVPSPELVVAALERSCGECSPTQKAGRTEVGTREQPGELSEFPAWCETTWFGNLEQRVGKEKAALAVHWTQHRLDNGEEIHTPRGYAAAVAEVYAGRRPGYVGERQVPAEEVAAEHRAILREAARAVEKSLEREDLAAAYETLLVLDVLTDADAL